jgi:hypothetical protein
MHNTRILIKLEEGDEEFDDWSDGGCVAVEEVVGEGV